MPLIYPMDIIAKIKNKLLEKQETIAVAESVTAGHLQAALSQAENARQFFQGGITAYNIGQKCRQLKVEPVHALEVNGVSEQVAKQMAVHVAGLFCSQIGVAVTGYATTLPEKGIDAPFAHFAISHLGRLLCAGRLEGVGKDQLEIQLGYVDAILRTLETTLH